VSNLEAALSSNLWSTAETQRAVPLSSLDSFHQSLLLPRQMLKANATQVHKAIDKPQSEI
jgi:hypothetical protein